MGESVCHGHITEVKVHFFYFFGTANQSEFIIQAFTFSTESCESHKVDFYSLCQSTLMT